MLSTRELAWNRGHHLGGRLRLRGLIPDPHNGRGAGADAIGLVIPVTGSKTNQETHFQTN